MHCVMGCGSVKLRKRKRDGLRICPTHGPVGPRPRVEALAWGITLAQRNAINAALQKVTVKDRMNATRCALIAYCRHLNALAGIDASSRY